MKISRGLGLAFVWLALCLPAFSQDGYRQLVALHQEFVEFKKPKMVEGVEDYRAPAMRTQAQGLVEFRRRLAAIEPVGWPTPQRVDYLLVWADLNRLEFDLEVLHPWSRDPGFYLDRMKRIPYADVPMEADQIALFRARLQAVPKILARAEANLAGASGELARIALQHLERYDGIGQGEPFRVAPPEGTVGWYRDLVERLSQHHPSLAGDGEAALSAVEGYRDWLKQNLESMTEPAWVGLEQYNWYLANVRLMPYSASDLERLGQRELHRWRTFLKIEENKNRSRSIPPLRLAASREEYDRRVREAELQIRALIQEQNLLTLPENTPTEFETDAFWMERPGGKRHFWEELQYRNALNNHIHASIPGHRFDGFLLRHQIDHPIRTGYRDGGRMEGWATYIEEMFLQAGLMDTIPRARELFYIALMKRASRIHVDIKLQTGAYSIEEANQFLTENVPFMEPDLGRYDLEIYLRRPTYGSGYLMGKFQLEKLLSERAKQLGDRFDLGAFHDEFLAAGAIPISLIRWEMTGLEDEVDRFWNAVTQ